MQRSSATAISTTGRTMIRIPKGEYVLAADGR